MRVKVEFYAKGRGFMEVTMDLPESHKKLSQIEKDALIKKIIKDYLDIDDITIITAKYQDAQVAMESLRDEIFKSLHLEEIANWLLKKLNKFKI